MTAFDLLMTVVSCVGFMSLVAVVSWFKTRGTVDTGTGYFLAGRGLGATFIAGSLLLTNLSAEQLIGLNGSAYGYNLGGDGSHRYCADGLYFSTPLSSRCLYDAS